MLGLFVLFEGFYLAVNAIAEDPESLLSRKSMQMYLLGLAGACMTGLLYNASLARAGDPDANRSVSRIFKAMRLALIIIVAGLIVYAWVVLG